MPLKLTRQYGDIIKIGNDIRIKIRSLSDKNVCLEIDAPKSVDISSERVDKAVHTPKGQQLTPEQQRNIALKQLNRGNK